MNIEEARKIIAAQFLPAGRIPTENDCLEVHESQAAAFDSIRDRNEDFYCLGGCGRKMNSSKFMVRPLNYTKPSAEYIVVRGKAGSCRSCNRRG